ncbi:hypothetical protein R5M92_12790 [Halomonas sp. Bachu 37]|uniref:hypothetical protein n=1 Tax=Halomonas kashgarensis TaxID=3084920 RepID=UPI003217619B
MALSVEHLSRVLFAADPMGTCCKENDCFDEYDAIADGIVSRCEQGQSLEVALNETFEEWFGMELAERVDMQALCRELTGRSPSA